MARGLLVTALITFVVCYSAICIGLYFFQRSFIYYPLPFQNLRASETLLLNNAGGIFKASAREEGHPDALLFFGGNGEDVTLSLLRYAEAFPQHDIYMLHYRGYGNSTGQPTEKILSEDAASLYDYVSARHTGITLAGRSLGSGLAIRLANRPGVKKLILITPYDSILSLAKRRFPLFPVEYILKDRYESVKYAPDVKAPTTLLAADSDEVIPLEHTQALLQAFKPGIAHLKVVNHTDHVSIGDDPDYFRLMSAPPNL